MAEVESGHLQIPILADSKSAKIELAPGSSNPTASNAPPTSSSSTSVPFVDFVSGSSSGRATSHEAASTSPRCAFAWITEIGSSRKMVHSISVPTSQVKHILGRGGRVLSRIEDLAGCFISVADSGGLTTIVSVMGGDVTLACFIIHALSSGFYRVFETLHRNGVSCTRPERVSG